MTLFPAIDPAIDPAPGIEPLVRAASAASDSALLAALTAVIVINLLMAPIVLRIARNYFRQMFRSRREALPGEKTIGERIAVGAAFVQAPIFLALALYCLRGAGAMPALGAVGGLVALTLGLYILQGTGYWLVGYAFASAEESRLWLSGYMISQGAASYLLIIPAMASLFYPGSIGLCAIAIAAIYGCARMVLFVNEFRIFYTSPASIIYFFLYLCTLEIVPLIAVWHLSGIYLSYY